MAWCLYKYAFYNLNACPFICLQIELLFSGKVCAEMREAAFGLTKRLAQTAQETFGDFEEAVEKDATKTAVSDGTVHPLTSYVINYVKFLFEYVHLLYFWYSNFLRCNLFVKPVWPRCFGTLFWEDCPNTKTFLYTLQHSLRTILIRLNIFWTMLESFSFSHIRIVLSGTQPYILKFRCEQFLYENVTTVEEYSFIVKM